MITLFGCLIRTHIYGRKLIGGLTRRPGKRWTPFYEPPFTCTEVIENGKVTRRISSTENGICDGFGHCQCIPPMIDDDCSIEDCPNQCYTVYVPNL